jgi:1-acyl-sn-glycerol-3-phosphate acyltransferase
MLFYFGRALFRLFFRSFCRWQVQGRENIPATGGAILAPNHISHLDPPLVGAASPRPVYFMAKRELFSVPLLGKIIRRTHAFPVSRDRPDREALKRAYQLLAAGELLVMFPEGTRSLDGRLQAPEAGFAMIAAKARVPVIPIALIGANRVLPKGSIFARPGKIKVRIGAPICYDASLTGGEGRASLRRFAEQVMQAVGQMLPPEMGGSDTG